jgi:hypothetical protein
MAYAKELANAWAAGLFEGEGSIEINRGEERRANNVRLRLNTTDRDVLERFSAVAGVGSIRECRAPSLTTANPHWKTIWGWSMGQADECRRLLNEWLPHLGERRSMRALEALALLDSKEEFDYRTCYCGKHFKSKGRGGDGERIGSYCSTRCRNQWKWQLVLMARAEA